MTVHESINDMLLQPARTAVHNVVVHCLTLLRYGHYCDDCRCSRCFATDQNSATLQQLLYYLWANAVMPFTYNA
jgi:hypothetical protein